MHVICGGGYLRCIRCIISCWSASCPPPLSSSCVHNNIFDKIIWYRPYHAILSNKDTQSNNILHSLPLFFPSAVTFLCASTTTQKQHCTINTRFLFYILQNFENRGGKKTFTGRSSCAYQRQQRNVYKVELTSTKKKDLISTVQSRPKLFNLERGFRVDKDHQRQERISSVLSTHAFV